jgi:hypothetical protein
VDEVHRIVPAREQLNDSDDLKRLMEHCDGAVKRFAPESYIDIPKSLAELFGKALDDSKFKSIADSGKMVIKPKGGQVEVEDWEFLHIDKIGPSVYEELGKRGMIRQLGLNSHWESVPRGVGGLVLSMLASQIAQARGFDAITDQPLAFALNGMYECTSDRSGLAEGIIASTVATVHVPKNIALLTPQDYAELRKCNSDVRLEFAKMVGEIKANSRLDRIADPAKFRSELDDIVEHIGEEMVKFRKARIATKINDWVPLALTSVVPVAVGFAFGPIPAVATGVFSFGVSAVSKLTYKAPQFNYPKVLQTLCAADDAAAKAALKKFT